MTWLTWRSFGKTAADLDKARLKLQMKQTCIIFDILTGVIENHPKEGHPGVRMWAGSEFALGVQGLMLGMEWSFRRGFAEAEEFWYLQRALKDMKRQDRTFVYDPPPWFRDTDILASHRSNLARRDPVTYGSKWPVCPENWPYLWPVMSTDGSYVLRVSREDKGHLSKGTRVLPAKQRRRVVNL